MRRNHPYGMALYKPLSTKVLRPGSVGYWNDLGDWNPIAQLDSEHSLQLQAFKVPEEELQRAKFQPITEWDRKYSILVTETDLSARALL